MRFVYWNSRSVVHRLPELQVLLKNVDVFICVETWLTEAINIQFPGFKTFRKDRIQSRGGGLLMLIRSCLAYEELSDLDSPDVSVELCGVCINNVNPSINVVVCYRSPGLTLSQDQWNVIFNNAKINNNSVIVGDFNSHNRNWNCKHTDVNGTRLENSLEINDLFLHNNNTYTYINMYHKVKSNIDLLISTINLSDKIDFMVGEDSMGSDHYPIAFNLNIEKTFYNKKTYKIKTLRTDWNKFTSTLEENYPEFLLQEYENMKPSDRYEFFINTITNAIKNSTPKKRYFSKKNKSKIKNPVSWWDDECNKIKRLRQASYKKWEFSQNMSDLIEFKRLSALAKKTFKKKKIEGFKSFATSINFRTDPIYVWNKCKIFKNKWVKVAPIHTPENLQMKDKVSEALNKLCPQWAQTDPSWLPPAQDNEFFDAPFDFVEFNVSLENKNSKSSPGLDGIDFDILKKLPIKYRLLLLDIYNLFYQTKDYPLSWRECFVHFVNKPESNGLRPLTLTSCLLKLFETLIKNRLQWWAETHKLIPDSQIGFRRGRSCMDNLVNLTLKVDEAFIEKKHVLAVFLDVIGAFNYVNIDILMTKLVSIGCSNKLISFVKFISHERYIHTAYTQGETRSVHMGVPQGGVLSSLLYLLYVSEIANEVNKNVKVSQFADDIALYVKCKAVKRGKGLLTRAVDKIDERLTSLGLELSPSKTQFLHFNNMRIPPGNLEISVKGHNVRSSDKVRFLGIIFDYKMTFIHHIDEIVKRCSRALNIVKYLCGTWWGSSPETLLTLYKSYVRSIIDFGSSIYFPKTKKNRKKLESIQTAAVRIALGYRRSTPIGVLLAESKLTLIRDRSVYLCECYMAKIMSNSDSNVYTSIHAYHNLCKRRVRNRKILICQNIISSISSFKLIDKSDNYNLYRTNYEVLKTSIPVNTDLGYELNNITNPNNRLNDFLNNSYAISIYTDGSKVTSNRSVGTACVCPELSIRIKRSIPLVASVFTAECMALNDAMDVALANRQCSFLIFSDSLSALQSLKSNYISIKTNFYIFEIRRKYIEFHTANQNNSTVKFFWVPSHIGVGGNEEADSLAKSATLDEPLSDWKVPFTDMYESFGKKCYAQTRDHVLELGLSKGRNYFQRYYSDAKKPWFYRKSLTRLHIVTVNRCRADHYNLAASLSRMGIVNSPKCRCGYVSEDLNHVLWQCPHYEIQRTKLLKKLSNMNIYMPLCVEMFLVKPNIVACKCIVHFLKECNLKI